MKYLYRLYQLLIAAPIMIVFTLLISLIIAAGCFFGHGYYFGYYPGVWWGRMFIYMFLLPVEVEGRENLDPEKSYVFVANHQGAFDIFLIYACLGVNFRWAMKRELRTIPFVGYAAEKAQNLFVDKRGPRRIKETYDKARDMLKRGMSLAFFPEGSRSFTGHMGVFRRGAFLLADELQKPVVPLTINGSFDVMPRMRDMHFVTWHKLKLTIHRPIYPESKGEENVARLKKESYEVIMNALAPEYQGFVENKDQ